jgi:hypothetical protein
MDTEIFLNGESLGTGIGIVRNMGTSLNCSARLLNVVSIGKTKIKKDDVFKVTLTITGHRGANPGSSTAGQLYCDGNSRATPSDQVNATGSGTAGFSNSSDIIVSVPFVIDI